MKLSVIVFLMVSLPLTAAAEAIPQLDAFIKNSKTFSASFHQRVTSPKGKIEEASGTVHIARPGRFRWAYAKPYEQLIIGDGRQIWIYDKGLAQVTRRQQSQALGKSPAALLAGGNTIENDYTLAEAVSPEGEGIEWLTATPKEGDHTFSRVRMGLKNNTLLKMELTDTFDNITAIEFSDIKQGTRVNSALFTFTPPDGVDVIPSD